MSVDIAKLRLLQRQAGLAVADAATAADKALPGTRTPFFGKDGLPEIRSARPDLDALRRLKIGRAHV